MAGIARRIKEKMCDFQNAENVLSLECRKCCDVYKAEICDVQKTENIRRLKCITFRRLKMRDVQQAEHA